VSESAPQSLPEWREFLTGPGTDWPVTRPASEDAVLAAEQRLGVRLPPSFRNFLLASDGWEDIATNAGTLAGVDAVEWFPTADPELWAAWSGPDMESYAEEAAIIERCLLLSLESSQGDYWLLSAGEVDANGEWRAYEWWAGDGGDLIPHDSFGALVHDARAKWIAEAEENSDA
jgi:SMI1/KNR4 family protein SUKH-1